MIECDKCVYEDECTLLKPRKISDIKKIDFSDTSYFSYIRPIQAVNKETDLCVAFERKEIKITKKKPDLGILDDGWRN